MNKEPVPDVGGLDESPYRKALERQAQINRLTNHIMQQLIAETPYRGNLDDAIWYEAQEWEQQNAFPDGITADDIHRHYLRQYDGE